MARDVYVKEFFNKSLEQGVNSAGVETSKLLEDTGAEITVLYGKDSAGNIDPLRTNANQQLQVEIVNASSLIVDPVFLANAEADIWDPATTATDIYEFTVKAINVSAAGTHPTVILGIDVGDAGSLADSEKFVDGLPLADFESITFGPFVMGGDDVLRGNSDTASAVALHIKAVKVA